MTGTGGAQRPRAGAAAGGTAGCATRGRGPGPARPARSPGRSLSAALLLLAVALGACSTGPRAGTPVAPAPTSVQAPAGTAPQTAPDTAPLLWPVTDREAARRLQAGVDGGAQPWTLDPREVALNYASATWGWTDPETAQITPGQITPGQIPPGRIDLTGPGGGTAHLVLVQPVRTGTTGIWVVSQAQRA